MPSTSSIVDQPSVLAVSHEIGRLSDTRRDERHARRHRLEDRSWTTFVARRDETHVDRLVRARDRVDVGQQHVPECDPETLEPLLDISPRRPGEQDGEPRNASV